MTGILDRLFAQAPMYDYELTPIAEMDPVNNREAGFWNLIVKDVKTDNVTISLTIDPRYQRGLGIPLIEVPVGHNGKYIKQFVPLGMGKSLNNILFAHADINDAKTLTVNELIPSVVVAKNSRYLWGNFDQYDMIDMSNLIIESGEDYYNFGYTAYQVLKTVENATGIKGRFRPKYKNPNKFILYSDEHVHWPDFVPVEHRKILGIAIEFNGKNKPIKMRSLVNKGEQQFKLDSSIMIPASIPPMFGEEKLYIVQDAQLAPDPLSEAEKEQARMKVSSGEKPSGPVPPLTPEATVDMEHLFDGLTAPEKAMAEQINAQYQK